MSNLVNNDGLIPSSQLSKNKKAVAIDATSSRIGSHQKDCDLLIKSISELFSGFDERGEGKISLKDLRHIMTETMIPDAFSLNEFEEFLQYTKLYTAPTPSPEEKNKRQTENAKFKLMGLDQARLMTRQAEEENIMIDYMRLIKNLKAGKPMPCL